MRIRTYELAQHDSVIVASKGSRFAGLKLIKTQPVVILLEPDKPKGTTRFEIIEARQDDRVDDGLEYIGSLLWRDAARSWLNHYFVRDMDE